MLADRQGSTLAELTTAAGKTLTFRRNACAEVQLTMSHEDDAAALLWEAVRSTGVPTLRAYRDGILRFNGHLAPFGEDAEEQSLLTPVFRSPFGRLIGEGSNRGRFTDNFIEATAQDAGAIATGLIDLYGGTGTPGDTSAIFTNADGPVVIAEDDFCGLGIGDVEATKVRDRQYQYANVGEAIVNLTNVDGGFDFVERYVDDGATMALFDVLARQGADMPAARFEYGPGTLANVRHIARTTEPPVNKVRVLGGSGLVAEASNDDSIAKYGVYFAQESQTDVMEQTTLDDKAIALLRPNPVKTVQFYPDFGLDACPKPWDDFWISDRVPFYARRGAFLEDVAVKINSVIVTVDENDNEAPEIPDPTTPDEDATLRASLAVEVSG
jgi:hypothetical protein